ncbi:hypothetical protein M2266_005292 [Streptomyces sp. SPB162]|nr:hypothetical protein [Streptomyces sp. SPB162]
MRLHVPVQHPRRVHRPQPAQHLEADPGRLQRGQPAAFLQLVGERARIDLLHHDPDLAVGLDHVVHRHDVLVPDPGDGPRLAARPLHPLGLGVGIHRAPEQQLLHRDLAPEPVVVRLPHHAHTATAQRALQLVPAVDESVGPAVWCTPITHA